MTLPAPDGVYPPINAVLEERIAPLVLDLRKAGFRTFSSCAGHDGGDPWINIEARDRRDAARTQTAVVDFCEQQGLTVAVGLFYSTAPHGPEGIYVERNVWLRLEVYAGLPEVK